jgi:hypothetical protein
MENQYIIIWSFTVFLHIYHSFMIDCFVIFLLLFCSFSLLLLPFLLHLGSNIHSVFLFLLWFICSPSTTLICVLPVCVYVCTFSHDDLIESTGTNYIPYAEEFD